MERAMFAVAIRLAFVLSLAAALLAVALEALGDVSRLRFVVGVVLISFASSWAITGRVQRKPVTVKSL